MSALVGLFCASFLAATLLPLYSEILFAGLLLRGHEPLSLWVVATCGNTLGSVFNWVLAVYLLRFQDRRWFPFTPARLEPAQRWFQRYGKWSLLLAWAPVGGDALTFVAGLMRTRLFVFVPLVAAGKGARYALLFLMLEPLR